MALVPWGQRCANRTPYWLVEEHSKYQITYACSSPPSHYLILYFFYLCLLRHPSVPLLTFEVFFLLLSLRSSSCTLPANPLETSLAISLESQVSTAIFVSSQVEQSGLPFQYHLHPIRRGPPPAAARHLLTDLADLTFCCRGSIGSLYSQRNPTFSLSSEYALLGVPTIQHFFPKHRQTVFPNPPPSYRLIRREHQTPTSKRFTESNERGKNWAEAAVK